MITQHRRPGTLLSTVVAAAASLVIAVPAAGAAAAPACSTSTRTLQQRLTDLHVPVGPVDGCTGPALRAGLQAFQKANGLAPDGVTGPATRRALRRPAARVPVSRAVGHHVEVDLTHQLLDVVDDGAVTATYTVSTGRRGFDTPLGTFRIFRKELRSWSVPYRVWMPYASYFTGGVAFHEGAVDVARSSHGCVHVPAPFAKAIYALVPAGTTVIVR